MYIDPGSFVFIGFPYAPKLTNSPPPGDIPSFKLFESEKVLAFLDIQPISKGHTVRFAIVNSVCNRVNAKIQSSANHPKISRRKAYRYP